MERVLILGAGEMQLPIIQKAKQMGVYSIVADFDQNAPGLLIADEKAIISTIDFGKVLQLAKEKNIGGILTTSDYPVNIVAKVAEELSLKGMSIKVAELCTNKYLQREFFQINGINTPNFKLIKDANDLKQINHFPSIIKPVDSSASRGVKKVNNYNELRQQFDIAIQFSRQANVIVEDYISGREFSVETYTQDQVTTIVAITEKLTKGEEKGFFVEDTHITPARITSIEQNLIINEVLKAILALEINNCPTHTEIKLNENGAFIIEIACRLGGDYITSDLVPLSIGVDMLENLINISLDRKINVETKWNKIAAVQFLNSLNYQKCVNFIEKKDDKIIRSEIKKFHNNDITSSLERMGYILLQTNTVEEMNLILNELN
ncbi:MAG: ATP-grasp domain-containing protein [Bacteroidia bacterium]|nr:ATP-grasp domain-containing protein [Bacteroidia bacterium]